MVQAVIAYGLVALAFAWVAWSVFVPRKVKTAVRAKFKRGR